MKLAPAAADPVTYAQLKWICACLALALLPHVAALPLWLLLAVCAPRRIRLGLAARGRAAPPARMRLVIAAVRSRCCSCSSIPSTGSPPVPRCWA